MLPYSKVSLALDNNTKESQAAEEISEKDKEKMAPLVHLLTDTETYVVQGISQVFKPLDDKMNASKVLFGAKPFRRPVKLSELRKILKHKPDYFK